MRGSHIDHVRQRRRLLQRKQEKRWIPGPGRNLSAVLAMWVTTEAYDAVTSCGNDHEATSEDFIDVAIHRCGEATTCSRVSGKNKDIFRDFYLPRDMLITDLGMMPLLLAWLKDQIMPLMTLLIVPEPAAFRTFTATRRASL